MSTTQVLYVWPPTATLRCPVILPDTLTVNWPQSPVELKLSPIAAGQVGAGMGGLKLQVTVPCGDGSVVERRKGPLPVNWRVVSSDG